MIAFSGDLAHWTADPEPLYKAGGNPTGLDKQYAHKIALVFNPKNETFYMFYNAVPGKNDATGGRGIGLLTRLDTSAFPVRIGGEAVGFRAEDYMSPKDVRKFDPFVPFDCAAALQAFKDSGVTVSEANTARIGIAMGAGIGGLSTIEENAAKWLEARTPRKISPFFIPGSIINAAAGQVSIYLGIRGPNLALVTACTTSTHSIGVAARCIQYGDADVMIAGGSATRLELDTHSSSGSGAGRGL